MVINVCYRFINTVIQCADLLTMSRNQRDFDNKSLYDDLKSAIQEDKLYWVRNDAKIRASLTSKNYDEFRDIVAAAHLTSLDRTDKMKKGEKVWNKHAVPKSTE